MMRLRGEWSVSVHRELEDVLEIWKRRSDPLECTAVLHVGFERPPSREFDEIAARFPGLMLLTASARFALPSGFAASEGEAGRAGSLPVYLGIRGWGYSVDEALIPNASHKNLSPALPAPSGWVRRYVERFPDASSEFAERGIWDESTYCDYESTLPRPLRRSAGIFRLEEILAGDHDDPCAFARAAPPWLSSRGFDLLPTTVRVSNVFERIRVKSVSDLGKLTLDDLLHTQNFGRKSVADLLSTLKGALQAGPLESVADDKVVYSTLLEAINTSLFKYPERDQDILRRRMGLGCPQETLQELGERYGITRERIRQIEAKAVKRIIREETWDDILRFKIEELISDRYVPLIIDGLEDLDPWFFGIGSERSTLEFVLESTTDGRINCVKIDDVMYVGAMKQSDWESALSSSRRLLDDSANNAWTSAYCQSLVQVMLPERCKEFRDLLWDHASRNAQFAESNGQSVLVGYGRSVEKLVQVVLTESAGPLHYSTIAALIEERTGRDVDLRRAHNAAANVAFLFAPGTFGLEQHLPISAEAIELLADEAEQVVAEGPVGRQWHSAEIANAIIERGSAVVPVVDKYILDIALRRCSTLEKLGRMIWSVSNNGVEENYKIDLRQAIISILQEAQTPLHASEIKRRLISMRGINKFFQIAAVDPIIRIDPGIWGLNDRDLSIKRPQQKRVLDGIVDMLQKRGNGIHYSELEGSPTLSGWKLSVTGFFGLAVTDSRLRVSVGGHLFLQEWGEPRRESLTDAVRIVMDGAPAPLAISDIVDLVEARLGRSCDRAAISACLQTIDAVYHPSDGVWMKTAVSGPEDQWEDSEEPATAA